MSEVVGQCQKCGESLTSDHDCRAPVAGMSDTPAEHLRALLKPPTWEHTLTIKVRFRDNPSIVEADGRLQELASAIDLLAHGFIDRTSGGVNLGEGSDWDIERARHSKLQSTEIEIIPDWSGHAYKPKRER